MKYPTPEGGKAAFADITARCFLKLRWLHLRLRLPLIHCFSSSVELQRSQDICLLQQYLGKKRLKKKVEVFILNISNYIKIPSRILLLLFCWIFFVKLLFYYFVGFYCYYFVGFFLSNCFFIIL